MRLGLPAGGRVVGVNGHVLQHEIVCSRDHVVAVEQIRLQHQRAGRRHAVEPVEPKGARVLRLQTLRKDDVRARARQARVARDAAADAVEDLRADAARAARRRLTLKVSIMSPTPAVPSANAQSYASCATHATSGSTIAS